MGQMIDMLKNKSLKKRGRVGITIGIMVGTPNWTNMIRVEVVP